MAIGVVSSYFDAFYHGWNEVSFDEVFPEILPWLISMALQGRHTGKSDHSCPCVVVNRSLPLAFHCSACQLQLNNYGVRDGDRSWRARIDSNAISNVTVLSFALRSSLIETASVMRTTKTQWDRTTTSERDRTLKYSSTHARWWAEDWTIRIELVFHSSDLVTDKISTS